MNPDHAFVFADGTRAITITQLRDKLHAGSDNQFAHHFRDGSNDFASWVRHVHHNELLANDLDRAENARECAEILNVFLEPTLKPAVTPPSKSVNVAPTKEAAPVVDKEPDPMARMESESHKGSKPLSKAPEPAKKMFVPPAGPLPSDQTRQSVPKGLELPKQPPASKQHGFYDEFSFREFLVGFFLGALAGVALSVVLGSLL